MIEYREDGASPDLLRLQRVHKKLLAALAERCEQLGVQWFLVAGSALGAIRHGDVIPWDDDIDIGLLRDDYELLCADLVRDPIAGTSLQSWSTDPHYALAFANLRLNGSYYPEDNVEGLHRGIFIDLFPYDILPRSAIIAALQRWLLGMLNLLLIPSFYDPVEKSKSVTRRWLRAIALRIRPTLRREPLIHARESISRMPSFAKGDWADCFGMFGVGQHDRTRVLVSDLVPVCWGQFGELTVPLPASPDPYLRHLYGDYRRLPPVDQRGPKHGMRVCFPDDTY